MKSIETVIFDMDGVIIDSEPIHMKIEQEIFRELGLSVTADEHQQYVGTSSREMWEAVIEKYELGVSIASVLQKKDRRYLDYLNATDSLQPVNGVREVIEYLHESGRLLVLASSATRPEIELVLDRFDIDSRFSAVVSGAELERSKPDPAIFIQAARLIRSHPESCCVIEDSCNGVQAAKAAGMKCIAYRNLSSGMQDLSAADIIVDSFESPDVIDRILTDLA